MRGLAIVAAILLLPLAAEARPARCTTTDDGTYACDFQPTDRAGSFRISAPGKPTFLVNVDEPGRASAFVSFGPRNVSLPGTYLRSEADPACWENDGTRARICVR